MDYERFIVESLDLTNLDANGEMLQTGFWGRFKGKFGWKAFGFKFSSSGDLSEVIKLLVLFRKIAGNLSFCYVPFGPLYEPSSEDRADFLYKIGKAIGYGVSEKLKEKKSFYAKPLFVRFDLPWRKNETRDMNKREIRKSPVDIQPPSTVILSLKETEETLLKRMKSKTRYNIRLAFKRGVEVSEGSIDDIPLWYDMYRETAIRDRIAIHSLEYYTYLFELARDYRETYGVNGPILKLLLAHVDGEVVAGNIVAFWGDTARYLYGASSNRKRNLMPTYALQWEAIRLAKRLGYRYYDFFGIPPKADPDHPMYGLYRFKTGFGGKIIHRYGCFDIPLKPFIYKGYVMAERWRQFYFKRVKKRLG